MKPLTFLRYNVYAKSEPEQLGGNDLKKNKSASLKGAQDPECNNDFSYSISDEKDQAVREVKCYLTHMAWISIVHY